ncbi:MAG TPA: hypothetical protein VFO10_21520 [Oligoflexus sp.]|uniref:hypothetical protein n=1 Tax=Oligoflexus sp. TaxID=1971216 RepID=UPI002D7FD05F|nr:hypothetical protein [Oligoflexus sp.]HET9239855.1 hypothetical protein [Oligoflexus sp.]
MRRLLKGFLPLFGIMPFSSWALAQNSFVFEKEAYFLENAAQASGLPFELQGEFYYRPGSGIVITAPHGDFDIGTYEIVRQLCDRHPKWSCILAMQFRGRGNAAQPFNVNRPTLLDDDDCERPNPLAKRVFTAWMEKVKRVRPRFYVEIHGNVREDSAAHIEVAHKGFNPETLKGLLRNPIFAVEGVDDVWFRASQNKACGSMQTVDKALHFELPASLRLTAEGRESAFGILETALVNVLPLE